MRTRALVAVAIIAVAILAPARLAGAGEETAPAWSFSASAYAYLVPEGDDYLQPTLTADRGPLHLEGRWSYEASDTASLWVGHSFSGGESLEWAITPMIGLVLGGTDGIAPGFEGSLAWRRLELYSEGEYVLDAAGSSATFFYSWSELTFAPVDAFRFGLVTQRTRLYDADREIERGLLVGVSWRSLDAAVHVLGPDDPYPTWALSAGVEF